MNESYTRNRIRLNEPRLYNITVFVHFVLNIFTNIFVNFIMVKYYRGQVSISKSLENVDKNIMAI